MSEYDDASVIRNIVSDTDHVSEPTQALNTHSSQTTMHMKHSEMLGSVVALGMTVVELVGIGFLYKPIWKQSSVNQPLDLGDNKKFIQAAIIFYWIDVAVSLMMSLKYMRMTKHNPELSAAGLLSVSMTVLWAVGLGYLTDLVFNSHAKITSTHLTMMKLFWVVYVVDVGLSVSLHSMIIHRMLKR